MAKIYTVKKHVDYEGEYTAFEGTLREVRAWINLPENRRDINDLELYSNDAPDVYSLLKPTEKIK